MRILILGHKGMLGRAVVQYFSIVPSYDITTINTRFGEPNFVAEILNIDPDYIINCIGKIPQKKPLSDTEYTNLNTDLPLLLDTLGPRVIHPTTDCEFKGDIEPGKAYTKTSSRDADDIYGISKAKASKQLEESGQNTKIIRTSIIGHEESSKLSLLDWFLSQSGSVRGYTNHFWNGVTTLEWAKQAHSLILNWEKFPALTQIGTSKHYSKYDILTLAKQIYSKDIDIVPFETEQVVNKCLASDYQITDLPEQMLELRQFFFK